MAADAVGHIFLCRIPGILHFPYLVVLPFEWINASVDRAVFNGQCAGIICSFLKCELENVMSQTMILHRAYSLLKPRFCLPSGIVSILYRTGEGGLDEVLLHPFPLHPWALNSGDT